MMRKTLITIVTLLITFTLLMTPVSAAENGAVADVCNRDTARLVIGDSRCYQLYRYHKAGASFVAVWGGHYGEGCGEAYTINSAARRKHMKKYVRASIKAKGRCTVFIFATINDYNYGQGYNARMNKLIQQARELKELSYEYKGKQVSPKVYIVKLIGFEPEQAEYNAGIDRYNKRLTRLAKRNHISTLDLSGCLEGENQGYKAPLNLHYNRTTLKNMWKILKRY